MDPLSDVYIAFDTTTAADVPGMCTVVGLTCPIAIGPGSPTHSQIPYEAATSGPPSLHTSEVLGSIPLAANQESPAACKISAQTELDKAMACPGRYASKVQACLGQQNSVAQLVVTTRAASQLANSSTGYNKKPLLLHKQLERDHSMAVLLMERRLTQLNQQLADSNDMQEQYVQQLQQAALSHKQQLRDAQAAASAQVEALKAHIAGHLQQQKQRRQHQHVVRICLTALSQNACCQRAAKCIRRWVQQRRIWECFDAWVSQAQQSRGLSEQQLTAEQQAVQVQQQQLLAAWQQQAILQQQWHVKQLAAATKLYSRRLLWKALSIWRREYCVQQAVTAKATARSRFLLLQRILQAWLQAIQDARMQSGSAEGAVLVQHCFAMWQGWTYLQHKQKQLQQLQQQHALQHAVHLWMQQAAESVVRRESAVAAIAAVDAKLHQQWGMQAFQQQLQESYAKQYMQQRLLQRRFISWKHTAWAAARTERLLAARAAAVRRLQLQKCLVAWWHKAAAGCRARAAQHANQLQDALTAQQAAVECAKTLEAAAAEQLKLHAVYNKQLQQQATDACKGVLASMQFFPSLCWRSLQFNTGDGYLLPRARHAVFKLDALQPHAALAAAQQRSSSSSSSSRDDTDWHSQDADVGGCLLVFGGVSGSKWLADPTMLLIEEQPTRGIRLTALPVPYSSTPPMGAVCPIDAAGASRHMQLPLAMRDFAACACGQNQFVVTGGFGGQLDMFHLQLCQLQHQQQLDKHLTAAVDSFQQTNSTSNIAGEDAGQASTPVCAEDHAVQQSTGSTDTTAALHSTVPSCYVGWEASWQLLLPRNPGPPGRCHHSVCYYAEGRSLVVFGGWADRQGCLNDVWLFHQDHMEWWQPEATGAWPHQRRSHAAALLGHRLYVHGGLDSSGLHLDDMWCLDMQTWQWSSVTSAAVEDSYCPAGRRAHCLEVVAERYLLLHGGYAGEGLLGDAWVYDTRTCRWMAVDAQGPASELPVPRALHTVTALQQRLVVLGGQGPLGPVGDVHFLECPAVQQGLQLLLQQQRCAEQLMHVQQRSLQLQAELTCTKHNMQEFQRQLQVARQHITQLQSESAAAVQQCSALQAELSGARSAAATGQYTAQQAGHQVEVLHRRLARARQGGTHAVAAAQRMEKQLHLTECTNNVLQQQLLQAQQHLQQQQLVLHERDAEVAVLRSELVESSTRVNMAAAASNSAQSDLRTALTRSNKLYTQELKHLQQLLQAARESQKQLAHELATLQAQKAASTPAAEGATATATCGTRRQAEGGVPAMPSSQSLLPQQPGACGACEIGDCQASAAAAVARIAKRSSSNAGSGSQLAADNGWHCMGDAAAGHAAQLLCMSADQLAAISSRQGRTQAQLELLQKQVLEQQAEIRTLKEQLRQEQNAARVTAATESESRAAAVQQLHVAEQQHQQQVKQLEEQVRQYKWKLWELEAGENNAARLRQGLNDTITKAPLWSSPEAAFSRQSAANLSKCALQLARGVIPACGTTAVEAVNKEEHLAVARGGASSVASGINQPSPGGIGEFTVRLLPKAGPADQLEMLPEVVKLFELHLSTMV